MIKPSRKEVLELLVDLQSGAFQDSNGCAPITVKIGGDKEYPSLSILGCPGIVMRTLIERGYMVEIAEGGAKVFVQ